MPVATKGFCATPKCPERVTSGHCEKHSRQRGSEREHRRTPSHPLLHTSRWKRTSKEHLALHPWCAGFPRGVHGAQQALATCTDHVRPAREHPELFWDPSNHQSLCGDCNRRKNIAEEGGFGR